MLASTSGSRVSRTLPSRSACSSAPASLAGSPISATAVSAARSGSNATSTSAAARPEAGWSSTPAGAASDGTASAICPLNRNHPPLATAATSIRQNVARRAPEPPRTMVSAFCTGSIRSMRQP